MDDVQTLVQRIALAAREASFALAQTTAAERNAALCAMAAALRAHAGDIVAANERDVVAARAVNTKESLIDRLMLDDARIEDMALALESVSALPDPLGVVQERRTLESGLELTRVSVPLGVVAVVYEARPNVTADAAGICLKSGNAAVLRGGSLAAHSNAAVAAVLAQAAEDAGLPQGCLGLVDSTDHAATDALMQLHGVVDVLVPRGGAGLIRHCVEHAKVPVIETGTGNCHVYVHETADLDRARAIVMNAKCRRYGVCNAAETLLVDAAIAGDFLPRLMCDLSHAGVTLHCDEESYRCASWTCDTAARSLMGADLVFDHATEYDWETEYLAPELAIRVISGVDAAIDHINRYGTKHSEAIVADANTPEGAEAVRAFKAQVDAAAVYVNASTAFTDGGQFGLGAEIGISTQKLHVRGPFALEALTSYKYLIEGDGQVRS